MLIPFKCKCNEYLNKLKANIKYLTKSVTFLLSRVDVQLFCNNVLYLLFYISFIMCNG